eukprot:scaffold367_cov46-Attheya_sp.AAC.3
MGSFLKEHLPAWISQGYIFSIVYSASRAFVGDFDCWRCLSIHLVVNIIRYPYATYSYVKASKRESTSVPPGDRSSCDMRRHQSMADDGCDGRDRRRDPHVNVLIDIEPTVTI